ncbi:MAG: hypothetical protein WA823_01715 [Candidatus Acidiferrales bacterium]
MKSLSIVGIVLIILGIIGFAYQGFSYTTRKDVADIGPIHATKDTTHNVPVPPVLSGLALIGGVVCLVAGSKSSS